MTVRPDLLLHPVRLRIVQALVGRPMPPLALKDHLGDVPQATLYRHLAELERGGLITPVAENRVRGGVERTYAVVEEAVQLGDADLEGTTPDDHFRYFATFVGTLLVDFGRYLDDGGADLAADRVGYRQVPLWLSDEELDDLTAELAALLTRHRGLEPAPGRRRRLLTTVVMPDPRDQAPSST